MAELGSEYEIKDRKKYLEEQISRGWKLMSYFINTDQRDTQIAKDVRVQLKRYEEELNGMAAPDVIFDAKKFARGD
jgi:hypothetical protein